MDLSDPKVTEKYSQKIGEFVNKIMAKFKDGKPIDGLLLLHADYKELYDQVDFKFMLKIIIFIELQTRAFYPANNFLLLIGLNRFKSIKYITVTFK
uniref:Reverse transcriptase domain-containing protein n=1 Tax=Strongyloides papillosus TaxID=174720 RepID=A0A0N5BLD4_STREA